MAQSILPLQQALQTLNEALTQPAAAPQEALSAVRSLVGTKKADIMFGQSGADLFVFNGKLNNKNVDTIFNFESGTDTIVLNTKTFKGLSAQSELSLADFVSRISTKTVLVNGQQSLELSYDLKPFKNGGEKAFAVLVGVTDIQPADFMVL